MKKFKRKGGVIATHLSTYEVELLSSLVNQLVEMISDGEPETFGEIESEDPFEALARDLDSEPDQPENLDDPVLRRLFPNPYPHDPAASADFRRYTDHELKAKKIADARVVLQGLAATDGGAYEVRISSAEVDAWLRTLTSVRLAVGIRLGITDAETADALAQLPEEDPRAFMVSVYDWLGFAQETLLNAL